MNSPLKDRIQEDMKNAMRSKDSERLGVIRLLLAAMKQREVDERIDLTDTDIINIINKMIKQRLDSSAQFHNANRLDLATKENKEIETLEQYLPIQISEAEIDIIIQNAINTTRANSMQEMGRVMAYIKDQLAGRADIAKVSAKVKILLTDQK